MVPMMIPHIPFHRFHEFLVNQFEAVPIPNAKELDQDLVHQTTQSILNWRTNRCHEWMDDGTVSTTTMKNVAANGLAPDNDPYQHQEPNDQQQQNEQDQQDQLKGSKLLLYSIIMTQTAVFLRETMCDRFTRDPRIDLVVNRVASMLDEGYDFVHFIPIEELLVENRHQPNFAKRLEQGTQHVIRKLARKTHRYFNMGGVGMNVTVYGAVLSLVSYELIEMELSKMGTAEVRVEIRRGGTLSLFGDVATRRLLGLTKDEPLGFDDPYIGIPTSQGLHFISDRLSRPPPKDVYTCSELQHVIHIVKMNLSYIVPSTNEHQPIERTQYLGGGAPEMLAIVYKLDDTSVLKLPIVHDAVPTMEHEKLMLEKLQPHENIPQVDVSWASAFFQKGETCSYNTLRGIRMVGIVGKPASDYTKDDVDVLTNIYHGIRAALEYANLEKNIIHLNVCPRHIIVDPADPTTGVQLISWGCAASSLEPLRQLRGSAGSSAFIHDELLYHRPAEYHPRPAHDMASFAYTMAAILYEITDQPPWCSGCYKARVDDLVYLKRRRTMAVKLVEDSTLAPNIKSELIMAM